MSWIPDRYRELRSLLRADRLVEDVDEELALHLALRAADLEAEGLSPAAAREEALRRFGNVAAFRAETRAIDESILREQRRMEILDAIRRETRHALRSLGRAPVFTAVAVLTLGLGIGATTAIFTLLNTIVLKPLPYPASERLALVQHAVPKVGPDEKWGNSVSSYFFYQDKNESFEELGAYSSSTFSLSGDGEAERVDGAIVSASALRVLGIRTVRGRLITDAEDQPEVDRVALLGYELWQSRYQGDPAIVGRSINVNAAPVTVVGIVEPSARLPQSPVQIWLPMQLDRAAAPVNSHWVSTYGRLRPGVTPEAAQRDLQRLANLMPAEFPRAYTENWYESTGFAPDVTPLRAHVLGGIEKVLWILLGAVSLVLLIACANIANLFLVRAESRRREQTVRAAMGAERAHFAVHYLAESALLGIGAAALGALLAYAGVRLLVLLGPPGLPRLHEVTLSAGGIAFAFGVGLFLALLFGIVPVLRGRADFSELRESGRGMTPSRQRQFVRSVLVVGQVGLALVLLTAGGLMLKSFMNLRAVQPGLDPENVLTFQIYPPSLRYATRDAQLQFRRELVDRIQALPGVTHVSGTMHLPLGGTSGCSYTTIEGKVYSGSDLPPCMPNIHVLPGYFEAMGIRVQGQTFTWSDVDRGEGMVVVSRAFANRMWPGEDPMGKGVISMQDGPPWYRVSGIADDVRSAGLDQPPIEAIYYPPSPMQGACCAGPVNNIVVRTATTAPTDVAAAIRSIVLSMDRDVPLANMRTMTEVINSSEAVARGSFTVLLLGIAAFMALFLSAVGLYGVIAYLVGRRRAEIGVRMALGARVWQVARLVMLQSLRLTVLGIAIGVLVSLIASRALSSLLYEVQPGDPRVLVLVSGVLLLVAMLASLIPARRAARTDPSEALRTD